MATLSDNFTQPQAPSKPRVVRDNLGKWFIIDESTKTRYPISGVGQLDAAIVLYGPPEFDVFLTGWTQGPAVVDLFGGPNGIEKVVAGQTVDPLTGRKFSDPQSITTASGTVVSPDAAAAPDAGASAFAQMEQSLRAVGLDALVPKLREAVTSGNITTDLELNLWLRDQQEFRDRFPSIFELEQQGAAVVPGGSLADQVSAILSYEESTRELLKRTGLDSVFLQGQSVQGLVSGLVTQRTSFEETKSRILGVFQAVEQSPPEVLEFFDEIFAGTNLNGRQALAAFVLNPDIDENTLLEAATTAQVGGAASRFGFDLTANQAQGLARDTGIQSFEQASQGFNQAARLRPLTVETISEAGTDLTDQDAIGAAFGTSFTADELLRRRLDKRKAAFEGGGGAAAGQQGIFGLGSAD